MNMDWSYRDARPPLNHSRRTWSNNGVQYTFESSSYNTPGFAFQMHNGVASDALPRAQQRSQGPGLLGTAFGLLGDVLAVKQQQQQTAARREQSRRRARQSSVDGLAYDDDENVGGSRTQQRPRSLFGTLAAGLVGAHQQRQQRRATSSREQSPPTGRRGETRQRSYQERRPTWDNPRSAIVEDETDSEYESEYESEEDLPQMRWPRRAFTANDASMVQSLERAAEHHRREAKNCRKKIEIASARQAVDVGVLQGLVNELKKHETAYKDAMENLDMLKQGTSSSRQREQTSRTTRHRTQTRPEPTRADFSRAFLEEEDDFDMFFSPRRSTHAGFHDDFHAFGPFADPFMAFNHVFNQQARSVHGGLGDAFFGMPQASFTFSSSSNAGPRPQRTRTGPQTQSVPIFTSTPGQPPKPPSTLLKPEEAKSLFKSYNTRWLALSPSDPNIPYPARNLKASSLLLKSSLWAPDINTPIASWSDEAIMQANAQAFFLGAVGLVPRYDESGPTGKLTMGYDKRKANAAQTKELVDMLKKEKLRWHSDRLGRRNDGVGGEGVNGALVEDMRARAVFHAVCALVETAQSG